MGSQAWAHWPAPMPHETQALAWDLSPGPWGSGVLLRARTAWGWQMLVPPGVPLSGEHDEAIDRWRSAGGTLPDRYSASSVTEVTVQAALAIAGRSLRGWVTDRTNEQIAALELFIRSSTRPADAHTLAAQAVATTLREELLAATVEAKREETQMLLARFASRWGSDHVRPLRDCTSVHSRIMRLMAPGTPQDSRQDQHELGFTGPHRELSALAKHIAAPARSAPWKGLQTVDVSPPAWPVLSHWVWAAGHLERGYADAGCPEWHTAAQPRRSAAHLLAAGVARLLEWAARRSCTPEEVPFEVAVRYCVTPRPRKLPSECELARLLSSFRGCAHEKPIGRLRVSYIAVNESALMARMLARHVCEELARSESSVVDLATPGGASENGRFGATVRGEATNSSRYLTPSVTTSSHADEEVALGLPGAVYLSRAAPHPSGGWAGRSWEHEPAGICS